MDSVTTDIKSEWVDFIHELQDQICSSVEQIDGKSGFREDCWEREGGGGGKTRVISGGAIFEKGGVNTSVVFGQITDVMRQQLNIDGSRWWACGLSVVLHPFNPFVPSIHCNYRMFEISTEKGELTDRWFGGGTDLTPYYLFNEDAVHFHQTLKQACDQFNPLYYPEFKKSCDDYFVNTHRNNERRGIGGIFYDQRRPAPGESQHFWLALARACGNAFLPSYIPIVENRHKNPFTEQQKYWQEIRRGRYVEFNLVHDRGTLFGLKTGGRIESILMSLPPSVRFEYDHQPVPGSEEDRLLQVCLHPKNWV